MADSQYYLDPMTGYGPFVRTSGEQSPNIILISMDMVPLEFHASGGAAIQTPNLQWLRAQHVSFARAYTTSPLCSPARAAYLTGRHSYITTNSERAHDGHEVHLRLDDPIFPEYLRAAGYHARHVGKCHVGAERFVKAFGENSTPWNRWSPPWFDDDEYIDFLHQQGLDRIHFERQIHGRGLAGQGKGNGYGGWIAPQNGRPFPLEATYPAYLVQRATRALAARGDDRQPFYLQLDFFAPHQPFAIPGDMADREADIRRHIQLPASYEAIRANGFEPTAAEPRVYSMYRRNWGLQDAQTVLDYRVANQLQFELLDRVMGRLFQYLQKEGIFNNTWIFVLGDHGEMNGESALIDKGAYLNPRVIRVPLFVKPAGSFLQDSGPATVDAPVSLLDLAPTILELAGVQPAVRLDGHSLLESLRGNTRPEERPILFEIWSHVIPNPCVGTVFTGSDGRDYLYTFNTSDPMDELYAVGPLELRNLWKDESARQLRVEAIRCLHARLSADERWKGYRGFLELTYPEVLSAGGDRQLFI